MPSVQPAPVTVLLQIAERVERRAHRLGGRGVERVVLRLHRAAGAGGGPPGEALGDEALDPDRAPGCEQVVGGLGAEAVGQGERALEVAQAQRPRQCGQLMHDHLGLGLGNGLGDRIRVERVGHDRTSAEAPDQILLLGLAGHADHLVPVGDELGNQVLAERPGGTCDEDLHDISFRLFAHRDEMPMPPVTAPSGRRPRPAPAARRSSRPCTCGRTRRPPRAPRRATRLGRAPAGSA